MQKADSLRAAIAAYLPELARDPDKLRLWVETGRVRSIAGASADFGAHFAWEYTLNVLVTEFAQNPSILAIIVNDWCRANQPDLLQQGSGYPFEADILDDATFDVQFALPLSEPVLVTRREGGGWNLEHPGEPAPLLPDDEPLGGILREIWHDGVRIVPIAAV